MEKRLFIIFLVLDIIALIISGLNMIFSFLPDWAVITNGCVILICIFVLAFLTVRQKRKADNSQEK